MNKLLYHEPSNPYKESPFDEAITALVSAKDVQIVCPYISLNYLLRIITLARSWRLVSDVKEWLSSQSPLEREKIYAFIENHNDSIHHYPDIHAKAVISEIAAYTGSANLTNSGVLRKTELGLLLKEKSLIEEMQTWFESLWLQSSSAPLPQVKELIFELNKANNDGEYDNDVGQDVTLDSSAKAVRARLVKILGEAPTPSFSSTERRHTPLRLEAPVKNAPTGDVHSHPTTPVHQPIGQAQEDAEELVELFIEKHASDGFTFQELHAILLESGLRIRRRGTYSVLQAYCASLPRSLFLEDAINRLVYIEGRFVQSQKGLLNTAIVPLDTFIAAVFKGLSFNRYTSLPPSLHHEHMHYLSAGRQKILIKAMVDNGLLKEAFGYALNEEKRWTSRLQLLTRSHAIWNQLLTKHNFTKAEKSSPPTNFEASEHGQPPVQEPTTVNSTQDVGEVLSQPQLDAASPKAKKKQKQNWLKQVDHCFLLVAHQFVKESLVTNLGRFALISDIARAVHLSEKEVSNLIDGVDERIRSPFLLLSPNQGTSLMELHPRLMLNADLHFLPRTKVYCETHPRLVGFLKKAAPVPLQRSSLSSTPTVAERTSGIPRFIAMHPKKQGKSGPPDFLDFNDVVGYQLSLAKHIAEMPRDISTFNSETELVAYLSRSTKIPSRKLNFLLSGAMPSAAELFRINGRKRKPVSLSLVSENISNYPQTELFLKEQGWPKFIKHPWFSNRRIYAKDKHSTEVNGPRVSGYLMPIPPGSANNISLSKSQQDSYLLMIFRHIHNRISVYKKFRSTSEIFEHLAKSLGIPLDVIHFLVGSAESANQLIFKAVAEQGNFRLEVLPEGAKKHRKSFNYLLDTVWNNTARTSWLWVDLNTQNALRAVHRPNEIPSISPRSAAVLTAEFFSNPSAIKATTPAYRAERALNEASKTAPTPNTTMAHALAAAREKQQKKTSAL